MKVADFDFNLPEHLIAQTPLSQRDQSRLLVMEKGSGSFMDHNFSEFIEFLQPKDILVLNDTRVLPARLYGRNSRSQGTVEILLLRPYEKGRWEVLVKPGKRAKVGAKIIFSENLSCEVLEITPSGGRLVQFEYEGDFDAILEVLGETPLPPYIHEQIDDPNRYQTVYAKHAGSVAAPTAGLHFTPELLEAITSKGVAITSLTLHVGLGTFRPVQTDTVEEHVMHEEFYSLSSESAELINSAKRAGGKVIAVGTTTVRVLESVATEDGFVQAKTGWTNIFIFPGYQFKIIDALLTNFHLPKSSLLMLVSAFAGLENIQRAYQHAVFENYRFFSFGDAMLLI